MGDLISNLVITLAAFVAAVFALFGNTYDSRRGRLTLTGFVAATAFAVTLIAGTILQFSSFRGAKEAETEKRRLTKESQAAREQLRSVQKLLSESNEKLGDTQKRLSRMETDREITKVELLFEQQFSLLGSDFSSSRTAIRWFDENYFQFSDRLFAKIASGQEYSEVCYRGLSTLFTQRILAGDSTVVPRLLEFLPMFSEDAFLYCIERTFCLIGNKYSEPVWSILKRTDLDTLSRKRALWLLRGATGGSEITTFEFADEVQERVDEADFPSFVGAICKPEQSAIIFCFKCDESDGDRAFATSFATAHQFLDLVAGSAKRLNPEISLFLYFFCSDSKKAFVGKVGAGSLMQPFVVPSVVLPRERFGIYNKNSDFAPKEINNIFSLTQKAFNQQLAADKEIRFQRSSIVKKFDSLSDSGDPSGEQVISFLKSISDYVSKVPRDYDILTYHYDVCANHAKNNTERLLEIQGLVDSGHIPKSVTGRLLKYKGVIGFFELYQKQGKKKSDLQAARKDLLLAIDFNPLMGEAYGTLALVEATLGIPDSVAEHFDLAAMTTNDLSSRERDLRLASKVRENPSTFVDDARAAFGTPVE